MFSFDALNDIDLDSYAYQLYDNELGTGTPVAQGRNKANVFTVSVDNSTDSAATRYWGRVAAVNSAGIVGTYTALQSDQATPQIGSQFIANLTAAKITSGTISAAEITLNGSSSILKSSNYVQGTSGWKITGFGDAEFNDLTIRTSLDIGGDDATSFHVDNTGNMWLGSGVLNYSTAPFRVSNAGALVATNANITGAITATSGSFSGSLSAATGTFQGRLQAGDIYLPNTTSPVFSVTTSGVVTATSGSIGGWSLNSSQLYSGSVVADDSYGQYVTLDSSASLVAYRKDFNYGLGEYWIKVDINDDSPGITVTGNSNGYNNTSAIRSSNISTRLFIHNEYTSGGGYGKFTATGSHVYFGDGSGSYTMRIVNSAGLYGQGTGGASTLDVLVNSNGTLVAPSSSIRFKENVNNLNVDYKKILSIQPVSFFYKDDSEIPEGAERAVEYGVIAEQVEEAGVPELVNYKDGVPFSVPYSKMPVFLLEVCRKQQEIIENLESRISLLESQ